MLFWVALGVWIAFTVGGLAYAALRGFQTYRQLKRTSGALTAELERISRTSEEIQANLDRAQRARGDLKTALGRLQRTRARLSVQLAAVREARAAVDSAIPLFGRR